MRSLTTPPLSLRIHAGLAAAFIMWAFGLFWPQPLRAADTHKPPHLLIQAEEEVSKDEILVKDIAEMKGLAGRPQIMETIGAISLGFAPRPGQKKTIPGQWIASVIRSKQGVPDSLEISVPEYVRIVRASQEIAVAKLEAFFSEYVAERIQELEFHISRFRVRGNRHFPPGKVTLIPTWHRGNERSGHVSLKVAVHVNGKLEGHLTLSGRVEVFDEAVTARSYLPPDTILTRDDLVLKPVNLTQAPANVITEPSAAVGMRTRYRVKEGACLRENMLEAAPMIYKGDRVTLVAASQTLKVVTIGVAKEDGVKGEQIRVENVSSGKTVVGSVQDASTVEVVF